VSVGPVGVSNIIVGSAGKSMNLRLLVAGATAAGDHGGTPIKHVVVIYQENVSFDHYSGTYPNALTAPPSRAANSGSLNHLFNFERGNTRPLLLEHGPARLA
jgi:phospholipase C